MAKRVYVDVQIEKSVVERIDHLVKLRGGTPMKDRTVILRDALRLYDYMIGKHGTLKRAQE